MRKKKIFFVQFALLFIAATINTSSIFAIDFNEIRIIKISPSDQSAVVSIDNGSLQVIKPGDQICENCEVIEITANRIIIRSKTKKGFILTIIRIENGEQKVQTIYPMPAVQPVYQNPEYLLIK